MVPTAQALDDDDAPRFDPGEFNPKLPVYRCSILGYAELPPEEAEAENPSSPAEEGENRESGTTTDGGTKPAEEKKREPDQCTFIVQKSAPKRFLFAVLTAYLRPKQFDLLDDSSVVLAHDASRGRRKGSTAVLALGQKNYALIPPKVDRVVRARVGFNALKEHIFEVLVVDKRERGTAGYAGSLFNEFAELLAAHKVLGTQQGFDSARASRSLKLGAVDTEVMALHLRQTQAKKLVEFRDVLDEDTRLEKDGGVSAWSARVSGGVPRQRLIDMLGDHCSAHKLTVRLEGKATVHGASSELSVVITISQHTVAADDEDIPAVSGSDRAHISWSRQLGHGGS